MIELSDYLARCDKEISKIKQHLTEEPVRYDTRRDLKAKLKYWDDQYWSTLEDLAVERIRANMQPSDYSSNN